MLIFVNSHFCPWMCRVLTNSYSKNEIQILVPENKKKVPQIHSFVYFCHLPLIKDPMWHKKTKMSHK